MSYLLIFCRCLVGLLFFWSSVGKLRGWHAFTGSLRDLRIIPDPLVRPVASGVVVAELAAVVLLALPATIVAGFTVAVVILLVFSAGIAIAVRRGSVAACACFGTAAATRLRPRHVVRNLLLALVAIAGAARVSLAGMAPARPGGVALASATAIAVVLLVVRADDIVALFESQPSRT